MRAGLPECAPYWLCLPVLLLTLLVVVLPWTLGDAPCGRQEGAQIIGGPCYQARPSDCFPSPTPPISPLQHHAHSRSLSSLAWWARFASDVRCSTCLRWGRAPRRRCTSLPCLLVVLLVVLMELCKGKGCLVCRRCGTRILVPARTDCALCTLRLLVPPHWCAGVPTLAHYGPVGTTMAGSLHMQARACGPRRARACA